MNLKTIAVLFALTLPLAGCGNKGQLVLPTPVAPAEPAAADATVPAEPAAPADAATPEPEPEPASDDPNG